jgi:hypothetical protein
VLKIRNNIVANTSIPTGAGRAVAVWRNYQPLATYDASSNNNVFTPGRLRRRYRLPDDVRQWAAVNRASRPRSRRIRPSSARSGTGELPHIVPAADAPRARGQRFYSPRSPTTTTRTSARKTRLRREDGARRGRR